MACRALSPFLLTSRRGLSHTRRPTGRELRTSAVLRSAEPRSTKEPGYNGRLPLPAAHAALKHLSELDKQRAGPLGSTSSGSFSSPGVPQHQAPAARSESSQQQKQQVAAGTPSSSAAMSAKDRASGAVASRFAKLRAAATPEATKTLLKRYGGVAVALHTGVFTTTLGSFWMALRYGVDVAAMVDHIPLLKHAPIDPHAGGLALAYAATLVTGPPRALLTLTATPVVAKRWWRFSGQHHKAHKAEKEEERAPLP